MTVVGRLALYHTVRSILEELKAQHECALLHHRRSWKAWHFAMPAASLFEAIAACATRLTTRRSAEQKHLTGVACRYNLSDAKVARTVTTSKTFEELGAPASL